MNDDFLVHSGGTVKSLGQNRIGGRVVTFSTEYDPDKQGDYFDANTDFGLDEPNEQRPVLWRHGMEKSIGRQRLGKVTLSRATDGIYAEGTLNGSREAKSLLSMVDAELLRWSTGAVGHLVAKIPRKNGTNYVSEWVIAECSLTDNPVEPRCIASLKSILSVSSDFEVNSRAQSAVERFKALQHEYYQRRAAEIYASVLKSQLDRITQELR